MSARLVTGLLLLTVAAAGSASAQSGVVALASAAQSGVVVQASAAQPAGCRAILIVEGKEQDLYLVRHTGDQLFFHIPNAPANAISGIKFDTIKGAEFAVEIDDTAVFEAIRLRQWKKAATLLLDVVTPCLPFLDLPQNNAADPALDAGLYLMRAAAAAREPDGAVTPAATALYEQALQIFTQVMRAEWYPGRERARLRAALCQTACGRLDEAGKLIEAARIPEPGDGDYGLHALARATLLFAQGKTMEACNAASRSVAFENKDTQVFPDALLLSARCHEELMDYYRARDIYFEVSRLFAATEWGDQAYAKLSFIMDNKLTAEKEKANIAKVFFGSEEDMDKVVRAYIKLRQGTNKQPENTAK